MIFLDGIDAPRIVLLGVLGLAMLAKAGLIAGYYMHLRWEHLAIGLAVLFGLLVNGAILFALIVPDARRILGMVAP